MPDIPDKPSYLDHRSRLRNRYNESGLKGLLPHEVIELFLSFAVPHKDVKNEAHEIIKTFGSVKGFFEASDEELSKIKHVKGNALTLRKFILDLSLLYHAQLSSDISLTVSKDEFIQYAIKKLGFSKEEEFWLISLSSKYTILKENLISKGLSDKAPVYPRKILELAIQNKAHAVLLIHNHPNGNPEPSDYDITVTKAIDIPAKVLNLSIYDHIIVSEDKYYSFKENKLI